MGKALCMVQLLCLVFAEPLSTGSAAAHLRSEAGVRKYKVADLTIEGVPQEICVLKGIWKSGVAFRYHAWDSCDRLTVVPISARKAAEELAARDPQPQRCLEDQEIVDVSNDMSRVLICQGKRGDVIELTLSD